MFMAGLSLKTAIRNTYIQQSMLDFSLMLWLKLPVADQPQNKKFARGVENNATSDSKLQ